jgi:hypothetical protein
MDRATFLEKLQSAHAEWEALLNEVGEARMLQSGATGEWSVKDVIAHIMWCEREMVSLCQARALTDSDLWTLPEDESNAIMISCYRDHSLQDVLAEERQVYEQLLDEVRKLSDEDLNDSRRFRKMPADWVPWEVIAGNSFKHYQDHILPVRAWLDQ